MFETTMTMSCNHAGCKKTFEKSGEKITRAELVTAAQEAGWKFVSASEQLCPDHRPSAQAAPTKAVKGKGKSAPKGKAKTLKGKVRTGKGPKVVDYSAAE